MFDNVDSTDTRVWNHFINWTKQWTLPLGCKCYDKKTELKLLRTNTLQRLEMQ